MVTIWFAIVCRHCGESLQHLAKLHPFPEDLLLGLGTLLPFPGTLLPCHGMLLPCRDAPLPFLERLLLFVEARLRCLEAALLFVEDLLHCNGHLQPVCSGLLRLREAVYQDIWAERDVRRATRIPRSSISA
ncbi:hypothetical protein IIA29_03585 [candidate division KSB1 bacterium]|nr:hypothetical protein [candidate division KSB1 bacterium]